MKGHVLLAIQVKVKLANFYHNRKLRLNVVSTIRQQSKKKKD